MSSLANFDSFKSSFKGDLITEEDSTYEQALARWCYSAARRAKVVAFPKDPEDVSLAVKYARTNNLPLAVKGGGHGVSGQSSSEGLVIDQGRYMGGVKIDAEKKVAYAGGGALWETVDREAIALGLATPGGTVNHTGVGGLLLGGGYGFLSGEHGLAVDNLVQATVVIASGDILVASKTSNPDLFFGIRGGGCNFGVVTEFVIRVHPQRRTVFAGPLVFPPQALEALVPAIEKRRQLADPKEAVFVGFSAGPDNKQPCVLVVPFFNGTEAEARERFKEIYEVGPVADMAKEIPYEAVNSLMNDNVKPGRSVYVCDNPVSGLDLHTLQATFARFLEVLDIGTATGPPEFSPMVLIEMWSTKKITSVPKGTMAFNSRGPQYNAVVFALWKPTNELGKEDPYVSVVRNLSKSIMATLAEGQKLIPEDENNGYGNYDAEPPSADKVRKLFGSNYPKLQELKKKYDPDMVFDKWQVIQPA